MAEDCKKNIQILTGEPKKAIKSLVVPILISIIVGQVNMFVDTIWCSGLGINALSAISLVASLYFLVVGIGNGIGIGASVAISRCIGANDREGASSRAVQTIVLMVLVSVCLIPILLLSMGPIISIMGGGAIMDDCIEYVTPMFVLCTFTILNGVISGLLRAEGATRKAMIVNIVSVFVNMILDPILIFGLDMGLQGASLATMLSSAVAVMIGLSWYFRGKTFISLDFNNFKFRKNELWDVLYVGIPQMIELNIMSVFNLILVSLVLSCGGPDGLAVYNTPWRLVSLAMVPATALGSAMIPVCSAAFGQKDINKAKVGFDYVIKTALSFSIIIAVIIALLSGEIVLLFTYQPGMDVYRDEMAKVICIYAIFMPFYGLVSVGSSMLQALRKSQYSLVSALLRNMMLVCIFMYACTVSMDAIYWGLTIGEIIGGLMMILLAKYEFRKKELTMIKPIGCGTSK